MKFLPNFVRPTLNTVRVINIDDSETQIEIIYESNQTIIGIELHGVDAELSWLKDESIPFELVEETEDFNLFRTYLLLTDTCEFRARAFTEDEDHWEILSHKLMRLTNGGIILDTSDDLLNSITYEPFLPEKFSPELISVKLMEVKENSGIVHIRYRGSNDLKGMELQGVDGGLSWLKDESVKMSQDPEELDQEPSYSLTIEITKSIEFRARGFDDKEDYWENGKNSRIIRNSDGSIKLEFDEEIYDHIEFKGDPPLDYDPDYETAFTRLSLDGTQSTRLFQFLIDISVWYKNYINDLYNQNNFDIVSRMMRYIKIETRKMISYKIDLLTRPIVQALYRIYGDAISYEKDDIQELVERWKEDKYEELFANLPKQVKQLDGKTISDTKDRYDRTMHLWTYN